MTGLEIHDWAFAYLCVAVAFGLVVLVSSDQLWPADAPTGRIRVALIAVSGALWPLLAIGLGQLALLAVIARRLRRTPPVPDTVATIRMGADH